MSNISLIFPSTNYSNSANAPALVLFIHIFGLLYRALPGDLQFISSNYTAQAGMNLTHFSLP